MNLTNYFLDRGFNGFTPALPERQAESFVDYVCEARNQILHAHWLRMAKYGNNKLEDENIKIEHNQKSINQVREIISNDSQLATFMRFKRSYQEIYKDRIINSLNSQRDEWLKKLKEADESGPGSVTYDPSFDIPDYAKVEIHIQPKGYVGDELAGLYYDCGTQIFFGGNNAGDSMHHDLAQRTAKPKDGKINKILDIGCSVGQFSSELKKRFSNSEVWGTDISAPMVRYAHWRAIQQNLDINFAQMSSANLDFEDNSFDLVIAYLLFHEIPKPVIKETLNEVKRVLRPGGTFVLWDFASASKEFPGYGGILGLMDSADNGEPYAPGFVTMGVENLIKETGFSIRSIGKPAQMHDRVCDKE